MKWFLNIKDFEIKQNIFKAFTKPELQNKYTKIISKNWRFKVCSTKRMIKRKKKPNYNSLKQQVDQTNSSKVTSQGYQSLIEESTSHA